MNQKVQAVSYYSAEGSDKAEYYTTGNRTFTVSCEVGELADIKTKVSVEVVADDPFKALEAAAGKLSEIYSNVPGDPGVPSLVEYLVVAVTQNRS